MTFPFKPTSVSIAPARAVLGVSQPRQAIHLKLGYPAVSVTVGGCPLAHRLISVTILLVNLCILGCKHTSTTGSTTSPVGTGIDNTKPVTDLLPIPISSVFHIQGAIVDEQGAPMDTGVAYTEGHFVSITQNSYRTDVAATPGGKFDIITNRCNSVSLNFGAEGYLNEQVSYGAMSQVPNPLRVVLHKSIPVAPPPSPHQRVVGKYIAEGRYMRPPAAYKTIALELRPDRTLLTTMTMQDGTTQFKGSGKWSRRDGDHLSWQVNWETNTPVTVGQNTDENWLGIGDSGGLSCGYDGPQFTFVAPSAATAAGETAPANAVGKYLAQGQFMPPYIPYETMELELKSDFSLAAAMTLPDQKTNYHGTGTWAWPEPKHGHIYYTVKWENGTPLPSRHPIEGDVLDPGDDDIHVLGQHEGGPDFVREPSAIPPAAPVNLVGKFISKSAEGLSLPRMPYETLEIDLHPDFTLSALITMPDRKTIYQGVGTWVRSGPWLIEPSIHWQPGSPTLPRPSNFGPEAWSIFDDGQRISTDYTTLYRQHD